MQIGFLFIMFIIGACMGSFLCCQARRLHIRESESSRSNKTKSSKSGKASKPTRLPSRSICLHCKKQLKWYDNLPIISWLILKGKCRNCRKRIGIAELLSEISLAIAFVLIGSTINISTATPLEWVVVVLLLLFTLVLGFLAIYDGLYGELPNFALIISIVLAIVLLVSKIYLNLSSTPFSMGIIGDLALSIAILGGLYLVLCLISKGKWVGDGDWILAASIAIALASPWLALLTLFLANFIACIIMYPLIRKNRKHKIHLGPFLVIAFVIVYAFPTPLMNIML